jgi:hypothetical protein
MGDQARDIAEPLTHPDNDGGGAPIDDGEEDAPYSVDHLSAVMRPVMLTMFLAW